MKHFRIRMQLLLILLALCTVAVAAEDSVPHTPEAQVAVRDNLAG